MKIKLKNNSKDAINKGDYYFAGGCLVLNCPFCAKKMNFGPLNVTLENKKVTIKGLDCWIKCCKYFTVKNDLVIEQ